MSFVKGALIFLGGAGVGSGVTYILIKKHYEERVNRDLEENRRHYQEKLGRIEEKAEVAEYTGLVKGLKYSEGDDEKEYISYDTMNDKEKRERMKEIEERVILTENPRDDYPSGPIVITEVEYSEDELYFDKIEAELYLGDNALVDENEELLNIEDTIGYDALEEFIESKENIIYIRNADHSTDYLISKVGGSYSAMMGLGGDNED